MDGWGAAAIAIVVGRVGEASAAGGELGSWGWVEWVEGECWVDVGVGVDGVAGVNSQGRCSCAGDFLAE